MAQRKTEEQMMLLELPVLAPEDDATAPATASDLAPVLPEAAGTPLGSLAALFLVVPDVVEGIMLVDPRAIAVDRVNARHGMAFDANAQGELIESMRVAGNTVPVRLRRDPSGGPGFLCPSGSQRLGAALHIQREQPGFRLRAIIADSMSNREAFALGEADNAGRTGVAPMQQARKWAEALDTIYGGNRQEFIAATGRSASVVSRTLALVALPDYVLAACSDVEALTPYFAEQLAPRLANETHEREIRRRAEALSATGRRLPGPRLIRALLDDAVAAARKPRQLWQSPDGTRGVRFKPGAKGGGRLDIADVAGLGSPDRRALVKAFDALLKELAADTPSH